MCCLKKTYRKSKIHHPSSVTFGCNRSRIQPGSCSSLISWKRPSMCFVCFPLPMRNAPCSSVFHQERASCTGDLYEHELRTCYVELTSCCCFLHSKSTQAYSQDPVPENTAYCQPLILDATLSDLETVAKGKISGGYACQIPDGTRTGTISSCQWRDL